MENLKELYSVLKKNVIVITAFVVSFWTSFGFVVKWAHYNVMMPIIDNHIDSVASARTHIMLNDWLRDSGSVYVTSVVSAQGGGFRGDLSMKTHMSRPRIVDVVSDMILNWDEIKERVGFQTKYNVFILDNLSQRKDTAGATVWELYSNNEYVFVDTLYYVWHAPVIGGRFSFFPPYNDNEMQYCYKLPEDL